MKKILIAVCVCLLLISCGSSDDNDNHNGTAPNLTKVEMVQKDYSGLYIPDYTISNYEYYNLFIYASDPDLDIVYSEMTYYDMNKRIISGPDALKLPSQSQSEMVYSYADEIQLAGAAIGRYIVGVTVMDATGQKSREFLFNVDVVQ